MPAIRDRDGKCPGSGSSGHEDLKMASQTSCSVLRDLGPQIQWVHSYVTDNKLYCVYRAPNEDIIREHARRGGFPCQQDFAGPNDRSIRRPPNSRG